MPNLRLQGLSMKPISLVLLLVVTVSGCTSSKAIRTPVIDSITIEQARENKETGKTVRWGGLLVSIDNKSDHSIVEIVEKPLTRHGVPKITQKTGGRFFAKSSEFLEPENFKPGRYITINGQLSDYKAGKIGDYNYNYPIVEISEYKIWPVNNTRRHYYPYHSFYYHDPFWGFYPYSFRHRRHHHHYW